MSQPAARPTLPNLDDPGLVIFLPMLYVAWADGELSPEEAEKIQAAVQAAEGIDRNCCSVVSSWLQADNPPSPTEHLRLLRALRHRAQDLPASERSNLVSLGAALARVAGRELAGPERRALEDVQATLGLEGDPFTLLELAPPPRPPAVEESAAPFELEHLQALLDGEHAAIRRRLRALLSEERFGKPMLPLAKEPYREQVLVWLRELAEEGFGSLGFPEEAGGGGDFGAFIAAFETLAHHDLSLLVKFGVQFGLFGGSILNLGTERHHRQYLPALGRLELPGCFAMSELAHGSNVRDLETTATFDAEADEWVIHTPRHAAHKEWIGNAALHGRMATVFAQLVVGEEEHGVHAFLVPIRDEQGAALSGVRIADTGEKMGLQGVDNGRLWFDGVRIPKGNLLDRFGGLDEDGTYQSAIPSPSARFFTMLSTLVGGRVSVASAAVSVAKSSLAIAVRYGLRRRQFGPPGQPETRIMDYRSHQHRLMPALAQTYALHFAMARLRRRYVALLSREDSQERRRVEALAAGLKAYATWHARDTAQVCREACGGQGYLFANQLAALKRDAEIFTTFEGDNIVLLQLLAKALLGGFRKRFEGSGFLGFARFLAERAATGLSERNPLATRRTDESHLLDDEFQLSAMHYREEEQLVRVARALRHRISKGEDAYSAFQALQLDLIQLAKSHTEHWVLREFVQAVEEVEEGELRRSMTQLKDLYALSRLSADSGWFLEYGYVEAGKARAIRKLAHSLEGQVRLHAASWVDGFSIPDALLAAPIATGQSLDDVRDSSESTS